MRVSPSKLLHAAVGIAACLTLAAQAQTPPNGRLLASNCFQCHGTDGRSSGGIEGIAGESASEIIGEMSEMSAGAIGNNIMKAHARSYTAEEIRLIAEYLATR